MNRNAVTIEDCIDMHDKRGYYTVINDGELIGFRKETENRKVLPPASKQD